jgi:hypothetical protein
VWRKSVFDIYFTEFGADLTTVLPVLFKYCCKYVSGNQNNCYWPLHSESIARCKHTICRRSWYIAAHIWKIDDLKIEVVPFIINFSTDLTTVVKFEVQVQKWCGCYSEEQVISMLEFLIDSIFVSFGGILFQQVVGIPMGMNCAPLLADLFLYSYERSWFKVRRQICYRWGTPAYWSLVPRSSMFYLFEFCLRNMWNCSLTQQILSHSFYDRKLYKLFLLSGF